MSPAKAIQLLTRGSQEGASDIHITVGSRPTFRINGKLTTYAEDDILTAEETREIGSELLPDPNLKIKLENEGQVDFSNAFSGIGRFRVNLYKQRGSWACAIRIIPVEIPELLTLGLPPVVADLALKERGLILVTGPAGSGKSTTLASMINLMNQSRNYNIITLEDPIEFLHRHGTCIINQREVGTDAVSFALGLRAALRQDPDVILVGEMRDLETIATAITAAETGHLVLASIHSGSAAQTVERIIDAFPPHQHAQIRVQLASCLEGIISQQLLPRIDGSGRVVAAEVLIANPAIRNLIRENKVYQIYSVIQTGSAAGMVTMEKSVKSLYQNGVISLEEVKKRDANFWGL